MAQIGDIVRYLNSVGGGRIVKIEGNIAYVDEDGFETPVMLRECVVVTPATPKAKESKYVAPTIVPEQPAKPKPEEIEETETGDKLNIVLAYEPEEIKHLNTTEYDAYLVNDSNYFLYFTYLTRADGHDWATRYAGIVEPNIQIHLEHVTREQLPDMDRVAIQYVAFKRDKEFKLKAPVAVEEEEVPKDKKDGKKKRRTRRFLFSLIFFVIASPFFVIKSPIFDITVRNEYSLKIFRALSMRSLDTSPHPFMECRKFSTLS